MTGISGLFFLVMQLVRNCFSIYRAFILMYLKDKPVVTHAYKCSSSSSDAIDNVEKVTLTCNYERSAQDQQPPEEARKLCSGRLVSTQLSLQGWSWSPLVSQFMKNDSVNLQNTFYSSKMLVSTRGLSHVTA